jgi:ribose-phosphate pyrophosphokinase
MIHTERETNKQKGNCIWLTNPTQNQRCRHGAVDHGVGVQRWFLKVHHRYDASLSKQRLHHTHHPHKAVMPYFPYSRQSKKKSHRGAITARMVANLLHIAGVNHVITIDLHASQMQGFFKCPVDNLIAEPLLARWIRHNVHEWKEAVVVSKNPGGTKRVTSLADALKLSFGIVTTDRRRAATSSFWNESAAFETLRLDGSYDEAPGVLEAEFDPDATITPATTALPNGRSETGKPKLRTRTPSNPLHRRGVNGGLEVTSSPLHKSMRAESIVESEEAAGTIRANTTSNNEQSEEPSPEESADEYTDEVSISMSIPSTSLTMFVASERCHSRPSHPGPHRRR